MSTADKIEEIEKRYKRVLEEMFEAFAANPHLSDDNLKEMTRKKLEEMKNKELEELKNS